MPIPLIAAALSAIAPQLAQKGLDLLSGVFRGAVNKGTSEIANLIQEKTGIDINDVADNKLTEAQWSQLKQFEFEYQSKLLAYRQQSDATSWSTSASPQPIAPAPATCRRRPSAAATRGCVVSSTSTPAC